MDCMLIAFPGIESFCGLYVDLCQEYNHFVDCLLILPGIQTFCGLYVDLV